MALANSIEQSADTRLEGVAQTAQTFGILNTHRQEFTPEEQNAYDKLRDAVMGISGESPEVYLNLLTKYLDATPQTLAPESVPAPANDDVKAEVPSLVVPEAPASEVAAAPAVPPPTFMARERGASWSVPETKETPSEAAPTGVSQVETPAVETVPAPTVTSAIPEGDAAAPSLQARAVESTPSVPPLGIEAAAKDIESINEALNEFGGWKALQWIHNPETGYRTYMKKLIEARGAVASARSGEGTPNLQAVIEELRVLALGVRRAVKGEAGGSVTPEATPPAAPEAAAVPEPLAPAPEIPQTVVETTPVVSEAAAPVPLSNPVSLPVETDAPTVPESTLAPQDESALNVYELPRANVMPEVQTTAPDAALPLESEAESTQTVPAPDFAPVAEASLAEQVQPAPMMPSEAPAPNPEAHTPEVEAALGELLTNWLGHTGWILRKSGFEHPDWHKMAPLTVGAVMAAAQEGKSYEGLPFVTVDNLAMNLRKWGNLYGISMTQHEDTTVDEIMHRIVHESLKK